MVHPCCLPPFMENSAKIILPQTKMHKMKADRYGWPECRVNPWGFIRAGQLVKYQVCGKFCQLYLVDWSVQLSRIYRVYFNDFGKVSGYYMGKKASCEFWVVSSSPITWSILISSFQKKLWSFSNSPYLKVHNCENMQSTLKTSFFKSQLFFKHLCNEKSDLSEILCLSS